MAIYYDQGKYIGTVRSQGLGKTSTGNPQFVVTFQIEGAVDPTDPTGPLLPCGEKYDRSVFMVITEKTIEFVTRDLGKLGFSGGSFARLNPGHPDFADFTGKQVELTCSHETYKEVEREKWNFARDGGPLELTPLDDKEMRLLDSLYGKHLKGLKKPTNGETKPAPKPAEKPVPARGRKQQPDVDPNAAMAEVDEEIPF